MKRIIALLSIGTLVLGAACSRQEAPEQEAAPSPAAPAQTPELRRDVDADDTVLSRVTPPERTTQHAELPRVPVADVDDSPAATATPPFRLTALIERSEDRYVAGLIVRGEDVHRFVQEGDEMRGYRVESINGVEEFIVLSRNGQTFTLQLESAPQLIEATELPGAAQREGMQARVRPIQPDIPTNAPLAEISTPTIPRTTELGEWEGRTHQGAIHHPEPTIPAGAFEPLDFEIEQGIDPHDPATWPSDYRGPGIERAIRGL